MSAAGRLHHEAALSQGQDGARTEAVARQHSLGKRTARERIALLADDGTFIEIGALATPETPVGTAPLHADALVTGLAEIDGRAAVVVSSDFTVAGGSNGDLGNEKLRRCWELAATRGIPVVMIFDGGGHRIQEGLDARRFAFGFDFQQMLTRLSGWVPLVSAVMGPAFGQPTLTAGLCDFVVAVRGMASIGMAPPRIVRGATGEDVDTDEIYSSDAQESFGVIDLAVDDEVEAMDAIRGYLSLLPQNAECGPVNAPGSPPPTSLAGRIDDLVPADLRRGYDMREVVEALVDENSMVELKAGFGRNMLSVLAAIDGRSVGIIANQPLHRAGMLDADAADKAAHLVSLCEAFALPVLVMMDLPGLAVGADAERNGLARSAARLTLELASATVPTVTILVRKGYGGGYIVMSGGRTFHPELVIAWPHAESGVMPVDAAVELVFRREIAAADDSEAAKQRLVSTHRANLGAVRAAEGFAVDAIVRPSQTREMLAATLRTLPRRRLMQTLTPRHRPVSPL
ncbi:acyl-CoA carboxylase subunit beta [Mycobacterium sp. SMC-19]|uniref:acyl-CoA carboxylase subunit beta n=1 Tax=Mycobacterium sp. SMC-19 TaxID=3381630 RepID=UPI003877819A